ncbi:class I SAM-dependent methyltransferase [Leifsonia sp. YIM 134122]|uniref:Class I SAM-dependent methyltransferase n=1 Tax=Leifsonia stereocauli TaxID=3134136 RepID=A0ABU9W4I6_9MICO
MIHTSETRNTVSSTPISITSAASFAKPVHLVPSAWHEHAPFAAWIVEAVAPDLVVELGTHNGFSYFQFCESIARSGLDTRAIAVDTWVGDDHAGFYGEDVYESVKRINDADYARFSTLFRGTFDEALSAVDDGSVDLLHIDGRHGYADVRHDFDSWRPKLSARSVVLFHDIAEYDNGFAVWQLWEELTEEFPGFGFRHGHGLGVLVTGAEPSHAVRTFLEDAAIQPELVRSIYEGLGARVEHDYEDSLRVIEATRRIAQLEGEVHAGRAEVIGLQQQLADLRGSTSWKVTKPLRAARSLGRSDG